MKVSTYKCELCPKTRATDTNKWFVGTIFGMGPDSHRLWHIEEWKLKAQSTSADKHMRWSG